MDRKEAIQEVVKAAKAAGFINQDGSFNKPNFEAAKYGGDSVNINIPSEKREEVKAALGAGTHDMRTNEFVGPLLEEGTAKGTVAKLKGMLAGLTGGAKAAVGGVDTANATDTLRTALMGKPLAAQSTTDLAMRTGTKKEEPNLHSAGVDKQTGGNFEPPAPKCPDVRGASGKAAATCR